MLKIIPRHQLRVVAWDTCVASSPQRIIYGYSWYLDAVLPAPFWKWVGLVLTNEAGDYQAVMPVPLRRKIVAGIPYEWVVHQPFFCQFLALFSRENQVDSAPFFQLLADSFRYGSIYATHQQPAASVGLESIQSQTTHVLDLAADYQTIHRRYTRDRKLNLRWAEAANWIVSESTDLEPLIALFREHHANMIDGGVAGWAYDILRKLTDELMKRDLVTLRYASQNDQIEAGALFVREGNRIIYLFNAASEIGRRGNARTLLIDQVIRANSGADTPLLFDFESPSKASIQQFYQSFGAVSQVYWSLRWNRLTWPERLIRSLIRFSSKAS